MSSAAKVIWTLIAIAAVVILGGVVTMLLWNLGVVPIVAACGGNIGNIALLPAICINIIVGWLKADNPKLKKS